MDGDLLINKDGFNRFMSESQECISVCESHSSEPIYVAVSNNEVTDFLRSPK